MVLHPRVIAEFLMAALVLLMDFFRKEHVQQRKNHVEMSHLSFQDTTRVTGLNCQAVCDSNLKFIFFGVVAPGKTNDNVAFPRCINLYQTMENLPLGLYCLGDVAYTLGQTLLTPYTGSQRDNVNHDAYNLYLSQLRIRIEMSFGRLVKKWQILKQKLAYRLTKPSDILMVCAKLHN